MALELTTQTRPGNGGWRGVDFGAGMALGGRLGGGWGLGRGNGRPGGRIAYNRFVGLGGLGGLGCFGFGKGFDVTFNRTNDNFGAGSANSFGLRINDLYEFFVDTYNNLNLFGAFKHLRIIPRNTKHVNCITSSCNVMQCGVTYCITLCRVAMLAAVIWVIARGKCNEEVAKSEGKWGFREASSGDTGSIVEFDGLRTAHNFDGGGEIRLDQLAKPDHATKDHSPAHSIGNQLLESEKNRFKGRGCGMSKRKKETGTLQANYRSKLAALALYMDEQDAKDLHEMLMRRRPQLKDLARHSIAVFKEKSCREVLWNVMERIPFGEHLAKCITMRILNEKVFIEKLKLDPVEERAMEEWVWECRLGMKDEENPETDYEDDDESESYGDEE